MKTLIVVITSLLLVSSFLCAQQKGPNISFEEETFNFGKILESKGPVSHTFNFTNTGSEPLVIQNVQPSCGCTTPEWSKEPIVPGGKGFIKATFNPTGRPGPFNKSISISSNSVTNPIVLKFSGEVTGDRSGTAENYPFTVDDLKFSSVYISYGKITPEKAATRNIDVLNAGNSPVTLSFPTVPPHMEVMVNPSTIKPNQKATIEFTYNAKKKNDWGFVSDAVEYTVNNKKDSKYKINLSANIEDDYSSASAQQLVEAPKMILEKNFVDIGTVKAGAKVEITFKFTNAGKTNLVLHKIAPSCGCTNVKAKENIIKPGASGEISGVFSSSGQRGAVNKTITLITNDPKNLNLVLWIRGTVQ